MKTEIHTDGLKGALKRSREILKEAAAGKTVRARRSITFESPRDMAKVLSKERVRLLQTARTGEFSVTKLAEKLGRDPKSVRRDLTELGDLGLLRVVTRTNPGHGKISVVKPVAKKLVLQSVI